MQAASEDQVSENEADALFAPIAGVGAVGACVSGGPDSLALLHLLGRWRDRLQNGPRIEVLTVEHGLRPSGRSEAEAVVALARGHYKLPARILRWQGPRPSSGVEEAAREARYRLLAEAAQESGISHLVLAHHRDDQAETVLMRLSRGSLAYGLAGMRPLTRRGSLTLFRPFLSLPKSRLQAVVKAAGLNAADDESNRDRRFLRSRLRVLMPVLAEEGLSADRLAGLAASMGRVKDALDFYVDRLLAEALTADPSGCSLCLPLFLAAPLEIRLRLLARLLRGMGGGVYTPRLASLEALERALAGQRHFKRTLAGIVVSKTEGVASFRREGKRGPRRAAEMSASAISPARFTFP